MLLDGILSGAILAPGYPEHPNVFENFYMYLEFLKELLEELTEHKKEKEKKEKSEKFHIEHCILSRTNIFFALKNICNNDTFIKNVI